MKRSAMLVAAAALLVSSTARAAILKRRATPAQAEAIDAALARLVDPGPEAMGGLFKAIGFAHPALPPLPGFPPA